MKSLLYQLHVLYKCNNTFSMQATCYYCFIKCATNVRNEKSASTTKINNKYSFGSCTQENEFCIILHVNANDVLASFLYRELILERLKAQDCAQSSNPFIQNTSIANLRETRIHFTNLCFSKSKVPGLPCEHLMSGRLHSLKVGDGLGANVT